MGAARQSGGRGLRRVLLPVLILWGVSCAAQSIDPSDGRYALIEDGSMPPWVVPVLRLVSSTHVEPTTGLVLSDTGLVLVPMGFAAEGDEVIVLDGGTDIVRNGRPAHLKDYFPAEGLQILSVPGLRRQPAPFAAKALTDGARVELTAFPPAERIAEGDPPLHAAAKVVQRLVPLRQEDVEPAGQFDGETARRVARSGHSPRLWRRISYRQTPVATETLSELTVPAIGIRSRKSHDSAVRRRMPRPSLPMTSATAPARSATSRPTMSA